MTNAMNMPDSVQRAVEQAPLASSPHPPAPPSAATAPVAHRDRRDAEAPTAPRPAFAASPHGARRGATGGDRVASTQRTAARQPPVLVLPKLPAAVGGVGVAFFFVQAVLGWGLGVAGAGLTVLIAAMMFGVLAVLDARDDTQTETTEGSYDLVVVGGATVAVAVAVACLYLPSPWGGLCAAATVALLFAGMRTA